MAKVVIYTTQVCPYCVRAKQLLQRKGVAYEEVDVSFDAAQRLALVERTGRRTVPQIFINDEPVGGSDELHALERAGRLDGLLAAP
ncbi:glutaredoxin 3 [Amnimonas aquatica]|uniref:Glutaredoxin n=1 Tax=Amnimonas aquatica TaxID=2094561 RepID=A0A2P6AUY8_9GAMM|nr:glutaredoxin 3 [Amnimonas aquatica]PQA51814.1 glutaredoxin 3 [Amnimonas aquatica]